MARIMAVMAAVRIETKTKARLGKMLSQMSDLTLVMPLRLAEWRESWSWSVVSAVAWIMVATAQPWPYIERVMKKMKMTPS